MYLDGLIMMWKQGEMTYVLMQVNLIMHVQDTAPSL